MSCVADRTAGVNSHMKLLYYYDDDWSEMKDHFEQSFKDTWDTVVINTTQIDPNSKLDTTDSRVTPTSDRSQIGGGMGSWLTKVNLIIDQVQDGFTNEIVTVADTDIIFYKPVQPLINHCMKQVDMCFQKENWVTHPRKLVNIGFISMRCNLQVLQFWERVREVIQQKREWDQQVVNTLLQQGWPVKWSHFPPSVFCKTQQMVPRDLVLHHANAAKTMQQKMDQFREVRATWRRQWYGAAQPHKQPQAIV